MKEMTDADKARIVAMVKKGMDPKKIRAKFRDYKRQQVAAVIAHATMNNYGTKPLVKITPADRKQIVIMAKKGMKADAIAEALPQYKQIQIAAVKAHATMGTYD